MRIWCNLGRWSIKRSLKLGAFLTTLSIIFINECLIYFIMPIWWNSLQCQSGDCTRIFFVADPQLLGFENENKLYGYWSRQDSDRHLKATFQRALQFTSPDVIIFLGDLLDEGSIASPEHFQIYLDRFKNIFNTKMNINRIYIPGDNDIGGENGEIISDMNLKRFYNEFMLNNSFDINNNKIRFFHINRMLLNYTNPDPINNKNRLRIAISHMSILKSYSQLRDDILNFINPHVIFSAHWHKSCYFFYPPLKVEDFIKNEILNYDLIKLKNDNERYLEIMIPTASYRMGEYRIGYGYAILDNNTLHYTVLWSLSRFYSLFVYLAWISLMLALSVMLVIVKTTKIIKFKKDANFNYQ
ncbi:metallophosphoesterase 1 homolog [Condylostylus longicornis]|uniref:metallophosphoesterase 1 homolog n=1 Tax=Condylostylus longicornis TaxID=2530218 RepID=UPI00244D9CE9|nr:metallophosphoesterase 1 homolog [Condylostylus longicornis]XP_055378883.1 metallophosphoesterase 1 homolog [Condylostylus longicornis]XP_055378953.1 metallophosphoesterase 1 homolog [Condylostylus longicornis]XP_055379034.1 metallophosphoesterase 1 homolog [Condylostylus longicornis]